MTIPGHPRLDANPGVCGGKPVIRGTRMRVTDILGALSAGDTEEEILADFPHLTREDIKACLAFGAEATAHPLPIAAE
jgi:uncharacterized protein (DUF433 family)